MSGTKKSGYQVTDKRFWAQDESKIDEAVVPEKRYPSVVEELQARTEAAEARLKQRLAELETESEAFRTRLAKETERRLEREKLQWVTDFIEILDNLRRALDSAVQTRQMEALEEGIRLNIQLFQSKLKNSGVVEIDPEGQPFDPRFAEAVTAIPTHDPAQDQVVLEVVETGYRLGDHLLRPARVRVGTFSPPTL